MQKITTFAQVRSRIWPRMASHIESTLAQGAVSPLISEMILYQMEGKGKRVRPVLCYFSAESVGADLEDAIKLGAAIETIHNASLVHDDIQDHDEYRRGRESAWKAFSPRQAINLGDMLMTLSLDNVLSLNIPEGKVLNLMKLMVLSIGQLINGQVLDIASEGETLSFDDYMAIASGKTGALFRFALCGGFLLGPDSAIDDPVYGHLDRLGSLIGVLFQMRDDIIEITGAKEGRPFSEDLRAQKASIMHITAMATLHGDTRQEYLQLCGCDAAGSVPVSRAEIHNFLRDHGVLNSAVKRLTTLRGDIEANPAVAVAGPLRDAVHELTALLCDHLYRSSHE